MRRVAVLAIAVVCALRGYEASAQEARNAHPGPLADGGVLLNSGWQIRPAGQSVPLGTFPMSTAVSNDGKFLLVLNGGIDPPSISVVEVSSKREASRVTLPDAWLGLAAAPAGNLVYVGGGSTGKVFELALGADGTLTRTREFVAAASQNPGSPFIGDVALSPDGRVLYAADLYGDTINNINVQTGKTVDHWKTGRRPYRILVTPNGAQLLISSWADGTIYEHESTSGVLSTKLRAGPHPTDMLWLAKPVPTENSGTNFVARLFVAAANTNNVYSFGVTADGQFTMLDTLNVSMTPMHPLGMTPSALSTDDHGTRLYVACSDANAIAVADLTTPHPRVLGFIPTGWYPTAVRSLEGQIAIVSGKGTEKEKAQAKGSLAFVPLPENPDQLSSMTQTSLGNSPYRDADFYGPANDPSIPYFARTPQHPSPIQHVIYVLKGSQTYDSVLGDLARGNGDKSALLFGENVTPNLHALAREFVIYDNFYADGDSPSEGQNWATAAIAPDYTVKLWASAAAGRSKIADFEGGEPANTPPAGYLWSNALQAGVTLENFGQWATGTNDLRRDAATDRNSKGSDQSTPDSERAREFVREWKSFDASGQAPQLSIVRLNHDDSRAAMADNDYALGLLADAVSHSKLWSSTAIFIVPAAGGSAQADHVDGHRTPAWVLSPYTARGNVDSGMYNQVGMLKTIELILGLRPMTHFDAGAVPMFDSFSRDAVSKPFTVITSK